MKHNDTKKEYPVITRLDKEEHDILTQLAEEEGRSVSNFVYQILKPFLIKKDENSPTRD